MSGENWGVSLTIQQKPERKGGQVTQRSDASIGRRTATLFSLGICLARGGNHLLSPFQPEERKMERG